MINDPRLDQVAALRERGDLDEAVMLLAKMIDDYSETMPFDSEDVITLRFNLGVLMGQANYVDPAIELLENVVKDVDRNFGDSNLISSSAKDALRLLYIARDA